MLMKSIQKFIFNSFYTKKNIKNQAVLRDSEADQVCVSTMERVPNLDKAIQAASSWMSGKSRMGLW